MTEAVATRITTARKMTIVVAEDHDDTAVGIDQVAVNALITVIATKMEDKYDSE